MLKAITVCYLVLPAFIFVAGWLAWPYAAACLVFMSLFLMAMIGDGIRALRAGFSPRLFADWGSWVAVALLFAWMMLSGTGGFGYQNEDYLASNALLKDLIVSDWPLMTRLDGQPVHLVYYVAYYLPAAVVGKLLGWAAANIFLFAWTFAGVVLAFAWFARIARVQFNGRPARYISLVVFFCLAGGLDRVAVRLMPDTYPDFSEHIEMWAGLFQFSSQTTLIYWVPQHTLAVWLVAGLMIDAIQEPQNLNHIGMPLVSAMIWSPFGVVGLIPAFMVMLIVYLRGPARACLFNRMALFFNASAAIIAGIFMLYLGSNQFHFPKGWIWQMVNEADTIFLLLGLFWVFEFGLAALITILILALGTSEFAAGRKAGEMRQPAKISGRSGNKLAWVDNLMAAFDLIPTQVGLFFVSLIFLFLLPLYKMGVYNDLSMRGSIASLFFFWAFISKVLLDAHLPVKKRLWPFFTLLAAILVIGFLPALAEITRSIEHYHFGPPVFESVLSSGEVNSYDIVIQRIANEHSIFYHLISK